MESLTTVASSNYPAGSDSIGNTLDDYLRAIQAILRRTEAQGAALTSTASMSLAAATGGYVHISGTDTIAHLGSGVAGTLRTLVFDDALTLTNSANLILPTGADITTAAGDVAIFRSEGSGAWRCISYQKADGSALVGATVGSTFTTLVVLNTATISALAVLGTATISALTVLNRATISSLAVTGTATFSVVEVLKTAVFDAEVARGTFSTTTTIDWTQGNKQTVTLGANLTFNFTAPPGGASNLILRLVQDGTGSRNPGWPGAVKWATGTEPTWSTAAGAVDIVSLYYNGSSYYGTALTGFA
jgi:hypothetical protein